MDCSEFQKTARRLAQGATEGDWRSGASRSYYAIFHFVRELFATHGLDLGQGSQSHSNLYLGLNNCGDKSVQSLAGRIDRLRRTRTKADYDLAFAFAQSQAQFAVATVDQILADFQALLAASSAKTIVAGAKAHLKAIGRVP